MWGAVLHTVPDFIVYAISISIIRSILCLEIFSRPASGTGLVFYAPRKGCWAEQSAVVLQELKQWPDVNHMLRSPGSALCLGSSREPRGLSRAASRAQDPPAQLYWAVRVGVCVFSMDRPPPLPPEWKQISEWSGDDVLPRSQLSEHQRDLDEVLRQRIQVCAMRGIFLQSNLSPQVFSPADCHVFNPLSHWMFVGHYHSFCNFHSAHK